jgi:hypothetical protein
MNRTKEYRLAQLSRKRNKYRKVLLSQESKLRPLHRDNPKAFELRLSKMVETPKPNKCQCCCNLRRSSWNTKEEKLTMQERRDKYQVRYELEYDIEEEICK